MTPDELKARTKKFALAGIRLAKAIPRDHINDEIASQLTDAAAGTAAAYRAACRPRSDADFIYKVGNAIEEVDEAALWLELLAEAGICARAATVPLWKEADELTRIFVASRETARRNLRARRRTKNQNQESGIKNQK